MNKGHFKRLYPAMHEQYQQLCEHQRLQIGDLWLYKTPHKWILNFPTKAHWRDAVQLENIEQGLQKFAATYAEQGITSVSFPLLGSGLGGLDWEAEVHPLLEQYLQPLPIPVFIHIHEPDDRFATQPDDAALAAWLHGIPRIPEFSVVWANLLAMAWQEPDLKTLDDDQPFQVKLNADRRLLVMRRDQPVQEFSASLLADVWAMICAAGYAMPGDFPGSAAHSSPLVSLLARLDYLRPVWLARVDEPRVVGLHLVPPVSSLLRVVEDN
jgi:hypothetical protein